MKIIQFIASSEWGGAEDSFVNICNELAKSHEIIVLLTKDNLIHKKINANIKIHILSSQPNRYNPFLFLELLWLIIKISPDIIHTHSAKATQLIHVLHRLLPYPHIGTKHNSRRGKIFNKLNDVTAVSQQVAHTIHAQHVKVIYNGIEPQLCKPKTNNIFTIRAIGRLHSVKGFDQLIQAVSQLNFPFLLEIIGEGEERKTLESLISKYHLENNVKLVGYQTNIPALISNADLIVISSHTEGFSLVLIESLFYAPLLISTKVSGSTEILPTSLLIEDSIAQKINDIYQHYDYYCKEFTKVKILQKHFLLSNVCKAYTQYYEEILRRCS